MTGNAYAQIILFLLVLTALVKPLGWYMAQVYAGKPFGLNRFLKSFENRFYSLLQTNPKEEMDWKTYAVTMLLFNMAGFVMIYLLQRIQYFLPFNPQQIQGPSPDSAFNTAISFITNTNWQGYSGESTMSYFTQMAGLTVQNFVSAAAGMAVLVALARGLARRSVLTIGNFWVDLTRSVLYVLLPLSLILSLILVSQGVPQTFKPYQTVNLQQPFQDSDGKTVTQQTIALGPVASQAAIKQLGTNGGGYFNANSAHPFENPHPCPIFSKCFRF